MRAVFCYRHPIRFGFLDGREGAAFHVLQGFWYRYLVDAKLNEVKQSMRRLDADVVTAIDRKGDPDRGLGPRRSKKPRVQRAPQGVARRTVAATLVSKRSTPCRSPADAEDRHRQGRQLARLGCVVECVARHLAVAARMVAALTKR